MVPGVACLVPASCIAGLVVLIGLPPASCAVHGLAAALASRLPPPEDGGVASAAGLNRGTEPQTLEQVGTHFGVTKERIRQLEARALKKLRKVAQEEKLDIPGI